jgi:hypothetical protein
MLSINIYIKVNLTVIQPFILYGCLTWCVTLREELWLRIFRNMILKKVLEPKRKEATGDWRTLLNEFIIYDSNQLTF